jgi:RND family efflux transporter MFP subunit
MKSIHTLAARRAKKSRSAKFLWPLLVLFVLAVGGASAWYFLWGPGAKQAGSVPAPSSQMYTAAVKRGDLSISAAGSGKLVAYQTLDLSFSTSGTVAELNVPLGDLVETGQVLASLGSSDTLKANLAAAKLQVLTAQKTLVELQENADLSVAQADSDLTAAQDAYDAALEESQRLAYARCGQDTTTRLKVNLERATQQLEDIHAETVGSDVTISAKKAYDTALANYTTCAGYTSDEKDSVQSALGVAESTLQEAQDNYDTLKAAAGIDPDALAKAEANLKLARARQANAEEQLAGVTLTAPISGKITYIAAPAGSLVGASTYITIADVSHSVLEVSLDESDIDHLVAGSTARVIFDALEDQVFLGKVVQVYPEISISGEYRVIKGLVELDADAVKTVSAMPLGLSASVTIVNQESKNTLMIPAIALKDLGDGANAVMLVGSDGKLRLQTVSVGMQDGDYAEITSGLNEGDLVSTGSTIFMAAGSGTSSDELKNAQNGNSFPGRMPPDGGGTP